MILQKGMQLLNDEPFTIFNNETMGTQRILFET